MSTRRVSQYDAMMEPSTGNWCIDLLAHNWWNGLVVFVILAGLAVASLAVGAFDFSSKTEEPANFAPTDVLECYSAYRAFQDHYPMFLNRDAEAIYIRRLDGGMLTTDLVKQSLQELHIRFSPSRYKSGVILSTESILRTLRYNASANPLAGMYLSPPGNASSTVFIVNVDAGLPKVETDKLVEDLLDAAKDVSSGILTAVATGKLVTMGVAQKKAGMGFAFANGAGLPFILIIFVWEVRSIPMLLLPVLTTLCSLIVAYGLGLGLANHASGLHIPTYVPQIMLFLCLALSIDYSFFLLTRFQEERRRAGGAAWTNPAAVMLKQSGHIVVVSGVILSLTWFALTFFPIYGLDAIGYCSGMTVLVCIVYNLLMTPALLIAFPAFFSYEPSWLTDRTPTSVITDEIMDDSASDDPVATEFASTRLVIAREDKRHTYYYSLGQVLTEAPGRYLVPAGLLVILACLSLTLLGLDLLLAAGIDFGSGPEADAFTAVSRDFPRLQFAEPFAVLGVATGPGSVRSKEFFDAQCQLSKALAHVDGLVPFSISGIAVMTGQCLEHAQAMFWLNTADCTVLPAPEAQQCAGYQYQFYRSASRDGRSGALTFATAWNPFSTRSRAFTSQVRATMAATPQSTAVQFHFYHPIVAEVDAEAFTKARFPLVFAGTLFAAFVLIALRFRAALVPLKLGLTIVVPIIALFGLTVGVYRDGWLNWTHIASLKSTGGLSWLLPVSSVLLLVGLALDYDLFLFARIYEFRRTGRHDTKGAICHALDSTGPVISGAGIIMALAFLGMLFNDNTFLNQFGFVMIVGVLLDTFVIRTVMVPAILSVGGHLNWWPSEMPACLLEDEEE